MISTPQSTFVGNYQKKVLIVDDSDLIRSRLCKFIDGLPGYEIIAEASNAFEALEKMNSLEVDIVILDVRMPGGNGIEFLKDIKKRSNPPIVLVYSNHDNKIIKDAYLKAGATLFLDKGKGTKELVRFLNNIGR